MAQSFIPESMILW